MSGDNLNYALTIKPLMCSMDESLTDDTCFDTLSSSDTVTINNKRREKFRMEVPVSLTLENITIDSLDSVLHTQASGTDLPACLSEYRQCCELDSDGVVQNSSEEALDTDTFSCSDSFDTLFTTMETDCFANWPRSLFKMRLTDDNDDI